MSAVAGFAMRFIGLVGGGRLDHLSRQVCHGCIAPPAFPVKLVSAAWRLCAL
jgi:hypothetical protein